MEIRELGSILWRTVNRFMEEGAMRYGAALAFYATLSLAPLLLLAVSILSLLARDGIDNTVTEQLSFFIGPRGAEIATEILDNAPEPRDSIFGVIASGVLLLFGGSALFVNVQGTLNAIWNVRRDGRSAVRSFMRTRLLAFLMIFATGLVMLISLSLGAAAAWLAPIIENRLPVGSEIVALIELAVSGTALALLCAATYRILPDVEIAWRDVWFGAALTAVLFLVGRWLIGWYLANAAPGSRFGAAGSGVALLLWLYYSALIFFFGAEFTQVRAERQGTPIVPSRGAVHIVRKEVELSDPDRQPQP